MRRVIFVFLAAIIILVISDQGHAQQCININCLKVEVDPQVNDSNLSSGLMCRGNGSQVMCDQTLYAPGLYSHPISCYEVCAGCEDSECFTNCYPGFVVTSWYCLSGNPTVVGNYNGHGRASCFSSTTTASGSGMCTRVAP